jgi:anti-anti-sigma factor
MERLRISEMLEADGIAILELDGHLIGQSAQDVKTRLKRLVEEGHSRLVVDLTQVSYIDSAGLAALVSGLKTAREAGGALELVGLDGQTLKVFRLTLLDRVFISHPDIETALDAISKK